MRGDEKVTKGFRGVLVSTPEMDVLIEKVNYI